MRTRIRQKLLKIRVDIENLIISQPDNGAGIRNCWKLNSFRCIDVVIDSVAALTQKSEIEGGD
jgi:RecA/RadA recombinase